MPTHGIAQIHVPVYVQDLGQMPSVNLGIEGLDADNQKNIKIKKIYVYFCHHMSHVMRKTCLCLMRTTKAQISLRIRAV